MISILLLSIHIENDEVSNTTNGWMISAQLIRQSSKKDAEMMC